MTRLFLTSLVFFLCFCCSEKKIEKIPSNAFERMNTYCFGRHLIDMPPDFYPTDVVTAIFSPRGLAENDGPINIKVKNIKISKDEFLRNIYDRQSKIVAAADETTGILKEVRDVGNNAKLFNIQVINKSYLTELHFLFDDIYVILTSDSYNNNFVAAEQRLIDFSEKFKKNKDAKSDGYCLGSVSVSGDFDGEYAKFRFHSKNFPSVKIGIEVDTYSADENKSLLSRVDGADSLLRVFSAKNHVIRKGEIQVASMKAQEWLSWIMLGDDNDKKKQFGFALETMRPIPSATLPRIHLDLDAEQFNTGGTMNTPPLNDETAVAIWDSVSRSIRLRVPNSEK